MAYVAATTVTTQTYTTRKYRLRNSPPSRLRQSPKKLLSVSSPPSSRGVLLPLPPNLRRLPSRLALFNAATMPSVETVRVGSKRKRTVSTNENVHAHGRSLRKIKRRRSYKEESEESGMDIDDEKDPAWFPNEAEHSGTNGDHYYLEEAPIHQLLRLRKEELIRLYLVVNPLATDAEHCTKHDLAASLIRTRNDAQQPSSPQTGPPSSPSSMGACDTETDLEESRTAKKVNQRGIGRSFSLSYLTTKRKGRSILRKTLRQSSNSTSTSGSVSRVHSNSTTQSRRSSPSAASSPLALRLRTRTVSFNFGDTNTKKLGKAKSQRPVDSGDEDFSHNGTSQPSPRRLRSKPSSIEHLERRVTPMRKAKDRVGSLKENEEEEPDEELLGGNDERLDIAETEEDLQEEEGEDEEVDELAPSLSPPPTRRTRARGQKASPPAAYELRRSRTQPDLSTPRTTRGKLRRTRTQISGTPSDGDDEETDGEDHGTESDEEEQTTTNDKEAESERMEVEIEPKRLRNGKIVGEDEIYVEGGSQDGEGEEENEAASIDLEAESNTSASDVSSSELSIDEEDNEEVAGEGEDGDFDGLQDATAKTLVRQRRDHLVRLCKDRGIGAQGTKPQLVEALLQWRDQNLICTSPSSGATARPPSTSRPTRRSGHSQTPVLFRSHRIEAADPDTPKPGSGPPIQSAEDGVLLDLKDLELEDSVIPPSKLSKLEKIGSGGFKDVFVGKLGGKKVAIAEFRGQLTEMDIKELKLLARFGHPNVVKFLGVSIPENPKETPMIVSELCSNGDLFDYIRNVSPPHLNKVLSLMLDIAGGLKYLHDHKPSVIHRDCKSSNILITSRVTAKIADFGLAKVKQSTRSMVRSLVGTVNWQAPELWHAHPKYNFKVDVFSCAMVFWEILQWHTKEKKFPWEGMNEHAIYEAVGAKQQRPSVTGLAKQWCPEIVELMEKMWAQDHRDRPDMTYVVEQIERLKETYPPPRYKTR